MRQNHFHNGVGRLFAHHLHFCEAVGQHKANNAGQLKQPYSAEKSGVASGFLFAGLFGL